MQRFLYYFFCTMVIGLIALFGIKFQIYSEEKVKNEYILFPYMLFNTIFPIVIGMLLRVPKLAIEIKEKKVWTFDWIKVIAIALPALIIASIPILAFTPFALHVHLMLIGEMMFNKNFTLITIAGIVCGYVLLDSLKK